MSKLEVDTIAPQSGTTITVGESGDTITIPTGVTLDASNATTTLPSNVVTTDGTQTLTNKTIDASQLSGTITPSDGTVTNAKVNASAAIDYSKLNLTGNIALADLSATGTKDATTFLRGDNTFGVPPLGGITEADQWRITSNVSGASAILTANWERSDTSIQGYLGTGMTESSGVFTFPSTGIWMVDFTIYAGSGGTAIFVGAEIYTTSDNSNYTQITRSVSGNWDGAATVSVYVSSILDITNTSTHKVKFGFYNGITSTTIEGSTNETRTGVFFTRLGDT